MRQFAAFSPMPEIGSAKIQGRNPVCTIKTNRENARLPELLLDCACSFPGRQPESEENIANLLIDCGARLHICDVSEKDVEEFRESHPNHKATVADVSDDLAIGSIFDEIRSDWNGLDALVNNAGIAGPTGGIEEISPADWRRCVEVCLVGQFLCAHFAVPLIKSAGGGSIINLSSAAGRFGYSYRTPYSSAKWGVVGFTKRSCDRAWPGEYKSECDFAGFD